MGVCICAHVNAGSDASGDCTCNAGYTGPNGGPCTACEAGKYNSPGAGACASVCLGNLARACGANGLQPCSTQHCGEASCQEQSSNYYSADFAVDGNLDVNGHNGLGGRCSHTAHDSLNPWWMVDL